MRSVFFNVFQSVIVLLYIIDNETNYVVIISVFIGKREGMEEEGREGRDKEERGKGEKLE